MDASTAASSRLIGAIFVEKGLVTQDQLEQALQLQEDTGERLGEILVGEFGVSRLELASVLAEQWAEFERSSTADEDAAAGEPAAAGGQPSGEPPLRRPIGEIFLERGFVAPEALERALEVQRQTGQRVGEVLVNEGSLTRLDLASALAEQWSAFQKLRPPTPVEAQPWQNGVPASPPAPPAPEPRREPGHDVAELEERIRAVERIAAGAPRAVDLEALSAQLRAAIAAVERQIADAGHDPEPVAAIAEALDDLRSRIDEPVRRVEAVERRLGEIVPSERFEQAIEIRLSDLGARIDHVASTVVHADELAEIRSRLGEIATVEPTEAPDTALTTLHERVDEIASRLAAPESLASLRAELDGLASRASADPAVVAALEERIASLASRIEGIHAVDPGLVEQVDALAQRAAATEGGLTGLAERLEGLEALSARIDELAAAVPAADAVEELRHEVGELAARAAERIPDERHDARVAELRERLDEVASRVEDVAAHTPEPDLSGLHDAVASLRAELAALSVRPPAGVEALGERIAAVEGRVAAEDSGLRALAEAVEEQRARLEQRLGELAGRIVEPSSLDDLRSRLEELAGRAVVDEQLAGVERRLAEAVAGERASIEQVLAARLGELAARVPAASEVEELRARLEEIAGRLSEDDELRARVAELSRRLEAAVESTAVEERLAGLQQRLDASLAGSAELLSELHASVAALERTTDEQRADARLAGLEHAVEGLQGVEDRVLGTLREHAVEPAAVEELRTRIEAMAERIVDADELAVLRARLEQLAGRLQEAIGSADVIWELREAVAGLESRRGTDAHDTGVRIAALESAIESLGGVEQRVVGMLQEHATAPALVDELRSRVEEVVQRLRGSVDVATVDERLAALETRLTEASAGERAALEQVLAERVDELEGRVAGADEVAALQSLLDELARRVEVTDGERSALDGAITGLRTEVESVAGRVARQEERPEITDPAARLDELALRLDEQARQAAARLGRLGEELGGRLRATEEHIAELPDREEVRGTIAEHAAALSQELEAIRRGAAEREAALEERLASVADSASVEALRSRSEGLEHGLQETRAGLAASRGEATERLGELERALRDEIASLEASAAERSAAERAELTELKTRVEELARAAAERDTRQADLEAGVDGRLREQAARAEEEAATVRALVHQGEHRVRDEVGSLGTRLDDLAVRAGSAAEIERGLRSDVDRLASVLEEKEAAAIDEREALRAELERAASSTGWRLERIEQVLAAGDTEELRAAVADLGRRLEVQQQLAEEQARQTERALRKGLASLGGRLAETQTAYLEAGDALCRSIERLGAAVVEADDRIAERDDTERFDTATSYVAFAPLQEGYRMIEVEGPVPAAGGTVQVPGCEGPLLVTRIGTSPLPLDARPCAYLERA